MALSLCTRLPRTGTHSCTSSALRSGAVFALVILTAADDGGIRLFKRAFRLRWLIVLGKYSYGLYVFHGIIAYAFERKQLRSVLEGTLGSHTLATLVQAAAGVAYRLIIAVASYELFEVRFLTLKRLFRQGRTRRGLATGTEFARVELVAESQRAPVVRPGHAVTSSQVGLAVPESGEDQWRSAR